MEHRELGRTGKMISLLSLGCMRLPDDDEEGAAVVRRAAELGINYFETSIWYCESRSEIKVGKGLQGLRDRVYISTKYKMNPGTTADDVKRGFEQSLTRLQVDRVDFYQVWDFRWPDYEATMQKGGGLDTLEKLRDEGLIGHIGITTHETNEHVLEMLDTGRFESVTLSYHMLNRDVEPVIRYAFEHGIGVVVMNPLAGGLLATPSDVLAELAHDKSGSAVAPALRFVMSNPYVTTIPSGMTSVREVEENVRIAEEFQPLTPAEMSALTDALDEYKALGARFCTGCGYCVPCPNEVPIPRIFRIRNYHAVFGLKEWARGSYRRLKARHPAECNECGTCETKCPNGIPIIQQLKDVAAMFEEPGS